MQKFKMSKPQRAFLVLAVLPVILGFLIYSIEFKVNYKEHPYPGIIAAWNTWHAYEHQWCYVLAVIVWFTAIWHLLAERSERTGPTPSPQRTGENPSHKAVNDMAESYLVGMADEHLVAAPDEPHDQTLEDKQDFK